MFKGSIVALITPLKKNYIDDDAVCRLVEWHIQQGTHGIVVCGSTGEGLLLSASEQGQMMKLCMTTAAGRIPIIANINALQTFDVLKLCDIAQTQNVNGLMVNPTPYIKATQSAIYNLFQTIHDHTTLPLILYNNPSRCGVLLTLETIFRLANLPRFIALKDSTGHLANVAKISASPSQLIQLCGEDALNAAFLGQGGQGWISVTANVMPNLCAELYNSWNRADLKNFAFIRNCLTDLHDALFIEASPAPVKYLLSQEGFCQNEVRPPLTEVSESAQHFLKQIFDKTKLLFSSYISTRDKS